MKLKRNAFYTFALLIYTFCLFFAMACVLHRLGEGQEYPYFLRGAWLLAALGLSCLLLLFGALWVRLDVGSRLAARPGLRRATELALGGVLLAAGFVLRYVYIQRMPMAPDSDYKTYYEIAQLLDRGRLIEEGVGYCDYVSMFPHVFGYPAVLARVFGLFGESVRCALLFNLAAEMGVCAAVWGIARTVGGRFAGLVSLAAAVFLPSTILYSNFVASEPLFTCVLLAGMLIFTISLHDSAAKERHPWLCTFELVGAGVVLAFGSFIRPMASIFVVAAAITLFGSEKPLPLKPINEISLGLRATNKGWKRCLILVVAYLLVSRLMSMGTAYAVDRELAGGSASFGYNLLVGLNQESYGGWNEEDANYLYEALAETGSAQEAQLACRDLALQRLQTDPRALLNLFIHKFEVLWGNDDFGASWNILFMDQQGNLTGERESFLYRMMDVSDLYYLFLLFGAAVGGCLALRRGPDGAYAGILLICGTIALHLLVENQNRYHFHALPLLAVMFGCALALVMRELRSAVMARTEELEQQQAAQAAAEEALQRKLADEAELRQLRAEALHAQFDMEKALKEGHIRIVASQSVGEEANLESKEAQETHAV